MMHDRESCVLRHNNGNCLPCGGFCLSINNEICEALQNAYQHGYSDAVLDVYKGDIVITEDEQRRFSP